MYNRATDRTCTQGDAQPVYSVGSLSACQRNAIEMALRWWADGGPLLDVYREGLMVKICINVKFYQRDQYKDLLNQLMSQHFILLLIPLTRCACLCRVCAFQNPWEAALL